MITIHNLTKKYGENGILEQVSYAFPSKGIVCLMGASGGGKTTLLNLLAGFDTNYDGDITIGGTSIREWTAEELCQYRRDTIGFVFQNYHLLHGYTVLENVLLAGKAEKQKAQMLLSRLGIAEKENEKVENLSGGQKQRVAIARALINNPQILFADEPTGALDRTTSNEIMSLLKEISMDRLVVVITHDPKVCVYADETIHIQDKKLVSDQTIERTEEVEKISLTKKPQKMAVFHRAVKNFKVHSRRYLAVSLAICIGMFAFLFSLSFGNGMKQSIEDFKIKNTAFNNGSIKGADDGTILNYLRKDDRIENVFYQYKLGETSLSITDKTEILPEKFPSPKATETLSYGVMPRKGKNEIALTPSLAKKFSADLPQLLGKEVRLKMDKQQYILTISGIYNAGYDDYFVSSDVEQQLYNTLAEQENYAISYDVKDFSSIVAVSNQLKLQGIDSKNAADEVFTLQRTFDQLQKLFFIISILVMGIGLFICSILLLKLQSTRYHEVGLLSALGLQRSQITAMITQENLLLAGFSVLMNLILLGFGLVFVPTFSVTVLQMGLCTIALFGLILIISGITSYPLIRTEPAEALRK